MHIEKHNHHDIHLGGLNYIEFKRMYRGYSEATALNDHLNGIYDRLGLSFGKQEERQHFLDLCSANLGKPTEDLKIGILDAHGSDVSGIWKFRDFFKRHAVQDWISQYDSEYDVLLLHVCNPKHVIPKKAKSILVIPRGNISIEKSFQDLENLIVISNELMVPINGKKVISNPNYAF